MSDPIVTVGARLLTHDEKPRSVVVTAVHDGVVTCRDEKTGETFAEVAAFAERGGPDARRQLHADPCSSPEWDVSGGCMEAEGARSPQR